MGHSDADRNFWVRTVFGGLILLMMGACILVFGKNFTWIEWTGTGVVFTILALALILPPKIYVVAISNINFAAIFAGIKGMIPFVGKKEPPSGTNPPAGGPGTNPPAP